MIIVSIVYKTNIRIVYKSNISVVYKTPISVVYKTNLWLLALLFDLCCFMVLRIEPRAL